MPAGFVIWGESSQSNAQPARRARRSGPKLERVLPHPFSATSAELQQALAVLGLEVAGQAGEVAARLPTLGSEPQPSQPFLRDSASKAHTARLAAWQVATLALDKLDTLALLLALPAPDDATPGVGLAADLSFWNTAAGFVLELLAGQRFAPDLIEQDGGLAAVWRPILNKPEDQVQFEHLIGAMPPAARSLGRDVQDKPAGPRRLLTDFLNVLVDDGARRSAGAALGQTLPRRRGRGQPTAARAWLMALAGADPRLEAPPAFVEQHQAWRHAAGLALEGGFRICFRLDPPAAPSDQPDVLIPHPQERAWSLRYFLQADDDPSLLVPAEIVWRERGSVLNFLNRKFAQPQERLLAGLGHASRLFAPVEDSLRSARPLECSLTVDQAYDFIREAALLLQSSGFGVLLPGLGTKLAVRVRLSPKRQVKTPQGGVARLGQDAVFQFDWQLALGDQPLSREEFDKLAALKVPLVQIRGQWVELRPEQLDQALEFFRKQQAAAGDGLSLTDALRMALSPEDVAGMPVVTVEAAGWLEELLQEMQDHARVAPLPPPAGFVGALRPYQLKGFAWLAFLQRYGLGACLADDMGLGKTIQTIALLLHERAQGAAQPALLVCPTSAMSNWQHEVARFAPSLRVLVHHGGMREKEDLAGLVAGYDIIVTSYALLNRDQEQLAQVEWGDVILDEAQNIKNPVTKQAQAARKLPAGYRIALTGTPVENRLAEMWSIFQFLNPGYLGSNQDFQRRFARPIERTQDPEATQQLKTLVSPFILRRLKTDATVINDLPAKNEMKVFCSLTREQVTLYEAVVRDSMQRIEQAEGIERRGIVLGALMKLKQVCNHPAQFLGDGSALADRSSKLNRLAEMLEEVQSVKERALIFTQFAEMGHMLKAHLQEALGGEVLFLHGGTPVKARTHMVERFQNDLHAPAVFVLSIKAGGTALNLTRANHVFHFDRWWNPAVENQATDRAFRIGQTRSVQVYKFLCAGTLEERIDEMIERKKSLAESIIGSSEAWITELSTDQLRDLLTLRVET